VNGNWRLTFRFVGKDAELVDYQALRLGLFFNMEPRFWLNLQSDYDMRMAMRDLKEKIAPRIRVFHQEAA
jgi:plasmid maintenance system antidote protein VapI